MPVQALILPSRGVFSITRDTWEQEYARGYWERMGVLSELGRYSIIAGYCDFLKPQGSILDIGCGKGLLPRRMSRGPGTCYLGVDISSIAIDQACAADLPGTEFVVANATTFEPPHPFDIVIFNEILYYFPDSYEQLRRYQRYLAPNGLLIISMFYSVGSFRAWKAIAPALQLIDQVRISNRGSRTNYDIAVFTPYHQSGRIAAPPKGRNRRSALRVLQEHLPLIRELQIDHPGAESLTGNRHSRPEREAVGAYPEVADR